jgi:F-type H+-transporting ATPase subunit alpha
MPAEEQVCVVYAGVRGFLDKMMTSEIHIFEQKFLKHLKANHPGIIQKIRDTGVLSKEDDAELKAIIEQFIPESGCKMKV